MTEVLPTKSTRQGSWFSGLRGSLYVLRVPIVMAAITIGVLTVSEQTQEVYRVLAQDRLATPGFQVHWLFALIALFALSLVFWQVARGLSYDFYAGADGPAHPLARAVLQWLPRVLATTPLFGAGLGLWLCHSEALDNRDPLLNELVRDVDRLRRDFEMGIGLCVALGVVLFVVMLIFEYRMQEAGRTRKVASYSNWILFPGIAVASVALLALDPIGMPQAFGVVPVFALWMAVLALLVGLLARLSIFAVPLLGLMILYVAGIEVLKLADNHEIRHEVRPVERKAVDEAFDVWLASRKDRAAYEAAQKPYPVYIVAAEGGGLYAAYLTAQFLTRMQDLCPSFAQHVFTVSSVSGGSLGAAVYAGLVAGDPAAAEPAPCKQGVKEIGAMEKRAKEILSADFLAPAVWGALFPDFLQRFIPHPLAPLDRARVLEEAFERTWKGSGANPMTGGMFDLCGSQMAGCLKGTTPLLAFNVTNVETGLQMVLSPLDLDIVGAIADPTLPPVGKIYDFFGVPGIDPFHMRLSTAVGLSARFPWVSPPGWYVYDPPVPKERMTRRQRPNRLQRPNSARTRLTFVDGGYVDNSGVSTALNIARYLDTREGRPNVEFRVIMVSALWAPLDRLRIEPPLDENSGELFPPVNAAINSRQGRGYKTQFDAALEVKKGLSVTETGFYYGYLELPLGWQLSDVSRNYISLFRGDPERCLEKGKDNFNRYVVKSTRSHERAAVAYIKRADCVVAMLRNELTPTEPSLGIPAINPAN